MFQIVNLQRKFELPITLFQEFGEVVARSFDDVKGKQASVAFIGDSRMKQLNELFRGKKTTTDVLSFPREPDEFDPEKDNLGDIVISVEQAQQQAVENGLTLEGEIKQLILHGLLHLCGYDHENDNGEMSERELELREQLGI